MKEQIACSMRLSHPNAITKWYYTWISSRKHINLPIRHKSLDYGGTAHVYPVKNVPRTVLKVVDTRLLFPRIRDKLCKHTREEIAFNGRLQYEGICKNCSDHACTNCEAFTSTRIIKLFSEQYHIMPLLNRTICKNCTVRSDAACAECPMRDGGTFPKLMLGSGNTPDDCRLFFLLMPKCETVQDRYVDDPNDPKTPSSHKQSLTEKQLLKLGLDMCTALQICYDHKIYHRDLKPGNIFVQGSADNLNFMLGDFGISRPATNTQVTDIATKEFVAPEFRNFGIYAPNSDLYSLGVTLFYVAGGRFLPYSDNDCELGSWNGHLDWSTFKQRGLISNPELRAIIERALMLQEDRYQTPMEMYEDLKSLYDNYRTSYSTKSSGARVSKQRSYQAEKQSDPFRAEHRAEPVHKEPQHEAPQPVKREEPVKKDPRKLQQAACDRLSEGDLNGAIALSKQGSDIGSRACEIILSYCRIQLVRKGKLDPGYRTHAENALLAAAGQGEPAALCLCATLAYERGDHSQFLKQIQAAAQQGFPAAQYIYGRGCCEGSAPFQPNTVIGWEYLCSAARSNYGDAIRYCLDYLKTHPQMECAQEIRSLEMPFDAMSATDRRRKDMADSFRNLV